MSRFLAWLGTGITLATMTVASFIDESVLAWGLPVGLSLSVIFGLTARFRAVNSTTARLLDPQALAQARLEGRVAMARVEHLHRHSVEVGEPPTVDLKLTVQPPGEPAYRTEVTMLLSEGQVGSFIPGTVHEVVRHGKHRNRLAFTGKTAGSRSDGRSFAAASQPHIPMLPDSMRQVPTFGLVRLNADGTSGLPRQDARAAARAARGRFAALSGLIIGLVIVFYPHQIGLVHRAEAVISSGWSGDLRAGDRLDFGLADLEREAGHDVATTVLLYKNMIRADMPLTPTERASDEWLYTKASARREGPSTIQPDGVSEQFSFAEVQWQSLWPQVQAAGVDSGLPTEDTVLIIHRAAPIFRDDFDSNAAQLPVMVTFSLSDDYRSATFRMFADGSELHMISES